MIFAHFYPLTANELDQLGYGTTPLHILARAEMRLVNGLIFPACLKEVDAQLLRVMLEIDSMAAYSNGRDMSVRTLAEVCARWNSPAYRQVHAGSDQERDAIVALLNTLFVVVASCVISDCDFIRIVLD